MDAIQIDNLKSALSSAGLELNDFEVNINFFVKSEPIESDHGASDKKSDQLEYQALVDRMKEDKVKSEDFTTVDGSGSHEPEVRAVLEESKMDNESEAQEFMDVEREIPEFHVTNGMEVVKLEAEEFIIKQEAEETDYELRNQGTALFGCQECNFKTKHRVSLRRHDLIHKGIKMFGCSLCEYRTRLKYHLKIHQKKHHDVIEDDIFKCNHCSYETKVRSCLKTHQMEHKDPKDVVMLKCDACDYQTNSKRWLKRHEKRHEDGAAMFGCQECDFQTLSKHYLGIHELRHKDPKDVQVFKCNWCEYQTKVKYDLGNHVKRHTKCLLQRLCL